ncbi:MAG TPA: tRNA (guanosine(37)-N1)-methyltransferase TrmD [Candidatus Binatia bacterium]|nr:tRNA (guanosine(37)-N1)-methyltransferase TrmD [Candidatus Binatia bacterium]
MKLQIITLFPEMFDGVLNSSMLWKAQKQNLVEYELINLRDFGIGPRKQVDDTPYGGGDGMVLKPEPLFAAVEQAKKTDPDATVLLMTPRGELFSQEMAREFAATEAGLILICGHYEGYDERITTLVDKELSVGKYILTGGELPAMVVADAVTRLIPGVLGGKTSAEKESFSLSSELEHPHYTRPEEFRGLKVPDVLLSGNHAEIESWRKDNQR